MNEQPLRQGHRTWDEAERKKHGKQVRERFAREREEKIKLAKKIIADLLDQGLTISQNEVARQSGISVGFINKHLKFEVERAKNKQRFGVKKPKTPRQVETVEKEVERLKLMNRRLQDQMTEEKRKNKELLAQVAQVVDLEDEIQFLKTQNRELMAYYKVSQEKVVNLPIQQSYNDISSVSEETKKASKPSSLNVMEQVERELKAIGITLNTTHRKLIEKTSEETVINALEAVKEQLKKREIDNPGGLLTKAIKERWTKAKPNFLKTTQQKPLVYTSPDEEKKERISAQDLAKLSNLFKEK